MGGIRECPQEPAWQEAADAFYMQHGPCCAGCDHWRSYSSSVGECVKTPPKFTSAERLAMIGIHSCSFPPDYAGHALTKREHVCGEFADTFDWTTLPLPYRRRIRDRSLSSGSRLADANQNQIDEVEHG